MSQRCYPRRAKEKIDYRKRDLDYIEKMGDIIQDRKEITHWSLFELMGLPQAQFYNIQRACLEKYSKTISYNKKERTYCYCAYVPKIELGCKTGKLEKETLS